MLVCRTLQFPLLTSSSLPVGAFVSPEEQEQTSTSSGFPVLNIKMTNSHMSLPLSSEPAPTLLTDIQQSWQATKPSSALGHYSQPVL